MADGVAPAAGSLERLQRWLLTDSPESAFHARCQRFYLSWCAFRTNPIAVIGLLIIVTLVLVAALAPLLTRGDGTDPFASNRKSNWLRSSQPSRNDSGVPL